MDKEETVRILSFCTECVLLFFYYAQASIHTNLLSNTVENQGYFQKKSSYYSLQNLVDVFGSLLNPTPKVCVSCLGFFETMGDGSN